MGLTTEKQKRTHADAFCLVAGRAGFECHPLNGGPRLTNKNTPTTGCVLLVAGRAGFEPATGFTQHSLSRRAHSATLAPPQKFVVATL